MRIVGIIKVSKILVPIYPKIRLKFGFIYQTYLEIKRSWELYGDEENRFDMDLFLCETKKYKEFLADKRINYIFMDDGKEIKKDKFDFLTSSLPKYIWILRQKINNKPNRDGICDATIVYPEVTHFIEYI